MKRAILLALVIGLSFYAVGAGANPQVSEPPPRASEHVKAKDLSIKGSIEGENILFQLEFTAECEKRKQEIVLVSGDVVLKQIASPLRGYQVQYDRQARCYFMRWRRKGTYKTSLTFAARPKVVDDGPWREATFLLPASKMRTLQVECDRADLEVRFPGALRLTRQEEDGKLTLTAVLGPGLPFTVRWKPMVSELDATLVLASETNTIATVRAGALALDSLYVFDIAQGKLNELGFTVPSGLNVTQVRGRHIQDWRLEEEGKTRRLTVVLNRPQTKQYALQVVSETALREFPTTIALPVILPDSGIHSGGHLALGTDSAIQLVVEQAGGLSQVEQSGFPRIILDQQHPRRLPAAKAFYYTYASTPYQLKLALDDIVPSFDVVTRQVVNVRENDLVVEAELDLDVRDAPLRELTVEVGRAFVVAAVTGREVREYTVRETDAEQAAQQVVIHFRKPVLGRTLMKMRLELGKSPLDQAQQMLGFSVHGAKNQRGYLVVVAERGVQLEIPEAVNLREVHTGSVPMRVPNAQFAYRFREAGWSLKLLAKKKPAGLLAESFHLVSLGDGVLYGYVVVNYFISGAPVDELRFRVPAEMENVEFVGGDVRRWFKKDNLWTVKLQRKVIGDYNLAVSYTRRYKAGEVVPVGGLECEGIERRTGYICIGSHLDLKLAPEGEPDASLLEIKTEEIPANYRLLLNAPVLKAYKYVARPHRAKLKVEAYERGSVLPVVIELMELRTEVNVMEEGVTESATRIRYKVKNTSSQFMTLAMPKGATVWATRLIRRNRGGEETATRVATSHDLAKGVLMIPLPRHRDPNDPITVEVEYGQTHDDLKSAGTLTLVAPASPVQATFASWRLHVPEDWAVLAQEGGNMIPKEPQAESQDLGSLVQGIAGCWSWVFEKGIPRNVIYYAGAGILLVLLVALFLRRGVGWKIVLMALLAALFAVGIRAASAPAFRHLTTERDLTSVNYTRALSLDDQSPLTVTASVVPAWRRYATFLGAVIVPLIGLACLALALRRRGWRPVLSALGLVGLIYGAAQFPVCTKALAHLFTWGAPGLMILWLLRRLFLPRGRAVVTPVAAVVLLALVLMPGCALIGKPLPPTMTVNSIEYQLTAEKDSMAVTVKLQVSTPHPERLPLLAESTVLISPEKISDDVEIVRDGGRYLVDLKKKGVYNLDLKFLSALAEPDENQLRHFSMPTPLALTNRVELTIPATGVEVAAPTAIQFTKEETEDATIARAIVGPGDDIVFIWKPRARQRKLEETSFFAELIGVVRFDTGLIEGRHRVLFRIAQGELKEVRIRAPENMTVTSVEGAHLGAWRFDPTAHELEARLSQPVSGEYQLAVTTQIRSEKIPARTAIGALQVLGAKYQRGILGLSTSPTVYITPGKYGQVMNVDDFTREAAALPSLKGILAEGGIRHAYRTQQLDEILTVEIGAVRPEIRSRESATFTVSDERLVYNGEYEVAVAKAGVFTVELRIPKGYDIDTLSAPEVSHWDESGTEDARTVQVHFRKRLLGSVVLKLALSRPESELPKNIAVPRVQVVGGLKHTGQISITSARGVRLSVASRNGVSELSALDLGSRAAGALAFSLLRPEWKLGLSTEVVTPRVNVEFLHVARVSDGLVRHVHYLRYRIHNAGKKIFEVQAPQGALGLEITGPDIAHLKEVEPGSGRWRVELSQKRFEQPYPLTLRYETQFEREEGKVELKPVTALDVDLQRGFVVIFATERTELAQVSVDPILQPADARNVPRKFGAGDLSGAAFCYSTPAPDYALAMQARRRASARLLEADVLDSTLRTVVSERGEAITHAHLRLRVGAKRHLEVKLPPGGRIWSVLVNLRAQVPSRRRTAAGEEVTLVPLAQSASGELPVEVDLIYVTPPDPAWKLTRQHLAGPQFDLPLTNISWHLYLPEGYEYKDFKGTLTVNKETLRRPRTQYYDVRAYEQMVQETNARNLQQALKLQTRGGELAQKGRQQEAKQALEWAHNYSFNDPELSEDTRVQLHSLIRQQAMVGLVGRRGRLRQRKGLSVPMEHQSQLGERSLGAEFSQEQADRLQNALDKDDSLNLERITTRLVEMQEEAARSELQLMINVPLRGRVIELKRPLQVKPNTPMAVSFKAKPETPARVKRNWLFAAVLAVLLALIFFADQKLAAARKALPPPPAETPSQETEKTEQEEA